MTARFYFARLNTVFPFGNDPIPDIKSYIEENLSPRAKAGATWEGNVLVINAPSEIIDINHSRLTERGLYHTYS
jgi:hypothetical protein